MKRHPALSPLSREHHTSLLLAQLLKKDAPAYKGMPTEPPAKAVYAVTMFKQSLQNHFAQEEAMLDKVKNLDPEIHRLANEIISEHALLTSAFLLLDKTNDNLINTLDDLGRALEQHIRKEERVLFPLIQAHCSEKELKEIEFLFH